MEFILRPSRKRRSFKPRATGAAAEELVKAAALQFADDARFRAAVLEAKAFADRDEFTDEAEMDARFEAVLRS